MYFDKRFDVSSVPRVDLLVVRTLCGALSSLGDDEADAAVQLTHGLQAAANSSCSSLCSASRDILMLASRASISEQVSIQLINRGRLEELISANGGEAAAAFKVCWKAEAAMTCSAQLFVAFGIAVVGTISCICPESRVSVVALVSQGPAEAYQLGYLIASLLPERLKFVSRPLTLPTNHKKSRQHRTMVGRISCVSTQNTLEDVVLDIVIEWDRFDVGAVGETSANTSCQPANRHTGKKPDMDTRGTWTKPGFRVLFTTGRRTAAYILVEVSQQISDETVKTGSSLSSSQAWQDISTEADPRRRDLVWAMRGMWVDDALRGRGLSRTCLLTWLLLCWKVGATPMTRRIRKPLVSLALQALGFLPTNVETAIALEIVSDQQYVLPHTHSASKRRRLDECEDSTQASTRKHINDLDKPCHSDKLAKREKYDALADRGSSTAVVLSKNEQKRRLKAAALAAKKVSRKESGTAPLTSDAKVAESPLSRPLVFLYAEDRKRVISVLSKSEMSKQGLAFARQRPTNGARKVFINSSFELPPQQQSGGGSKNSGTGIIIGSDSSSSCCAAASVEASVSGQQLEDPIANTTSCLNTTNEIGHFFSLSADDGVPSRDVLESDSKVGVTQRLMRELVDTFHPMTLPMGMHERPSPGLDTNYGSDGRKSKQRRQIVSLALFSAKLFQATEISGGSGK